MLFHDYSTMREKLWRGGTEEYLRWFVQQPCKQDQNGFASTMCAGLELSWLTHGRPYYNVYPIAVDLCLKTSLNMKWGDVTFPLRSLLLRFAHGFSPLHMTTALVRVPSDSSWSTPATHHSSRKKAADLSRCFPLMAHMQTDNESGGFWTYAPTSDLREELISDSLVVCKDTMRKDGASFLFTDKSNFLIRLLAFIGLLARGTDLVTPAILASDRDEYDATSDQSRRRWLEERARKKLGLSFDVGRSLEIAKSSSPHWRAPHLALFHTGPGRTRPTLKVRSGCVVFPKDMSHVPTGYLGPERNDELDAAAKPVVFRTSVSKRLRFRVMRRDGYRCRLCGMTRDDGVTLEVDHIVAVANGGATQESNLWTLCHPCNNGKSDMQLHHEQESLTSVPR